MINYNYFYVMGFIISFLVACESHEDTQLTTYIAEVKARKAMPIEPIPPVIPVMKFSYPETENRSSPFKQKLDKGDKFDSHQRRAKQPLEQYPLKSLKLVGILKQDTAIWGLITKPDGDVLRARIGDYIGENSGRIISISETSLHIEETLRVSGRWKKKHIIFKLQAAQ